VSRFQPFRGVRYDPTRVDLADVTVPPYDVIDAADRRALAARHPASAIVIDLPAAPSGSAGDDPGGAIAEDVYAGAAHTLHQWLAEGVVRRDDSPTFYVYRMSYADEHGHRRHTTGVFGALELSRPAEGHILPHEFTTPKAKSDRLNLTRATRANLSAVWGLTASPGLTALLEVESPPEAEWLDDAGVEHSLWTITDPVRQAAISAIADASPVVIADGHHRYETALTYRDEQRDAGADATPGAEATLLYLVELAEDELTVLPIHRLIDGLPVDLDLGEALQPFFEILPAGSIGPDIADRMGAEGALTLVLPDASWFLVPRPDAMAGVRDLDTSRLDLALAALPPHRLTFQHGVDHVVDRVAAGDAQAGVLLRPASVAQIIDIAHGGERMPPKTTFFHPKPRTGVVFRLLDE
jgi:uncharacterized protein (DUF1015 family)